MRRIDPAFIPEMICIEQMLYDYCAELDSGAVNVTDYFTEDCVFLVGGTTWNGHAGLGDHYADDRKCVAIYYEDGKRTVRHGLLNLRITVESAHRAKVDVIFLNFSAGGKGPFKQQSAPTVVADTNMTLLLGADGYWRMDKFYATPRFFGDDPYLNTILAEM